MTPTPIFPAPRTPIRWKSILRSVPPGWVTTSPLASSCRARNSGLNIRVFSGSAQFPGKKCHRRALEESNNRQIQLEFFLDPGNHLDSSKRGPPHFKEVIVETNSWPG